MPIGRPLDLTANVATKIISATATAGQTEFTVTGGYRVNELGVYRNGVRLVDEKDFTATDGSLVTLIEGATADDTLAFHVFDSFNISDAVNANASSNTLSGNLTVGGNLTVNGSNNISIPGINTTGFSTFNQLKASGITTISNTTAATNTTTGALIVSGGVGIAKSLFVGEGISIAGTITYNDVTNVDSIGIVTAGKGLRATTGGLVVTAGNVKVTAGIASVGAGVTVSSDFIHLTDNSKIQLGIASDLTIQHNATNSVINNTTGQLRVAGDDLRLMNKDEDETYATFANDGAATLYHDNSAKLTTIGAGVSVFGGLRVQSGLMRERVNISGTALNSAKVINVSDGMMHYRSAAVGGANVKLNVISNAGINTDLAIGDVIAVTVSTITGNTAHFVDQIQVDGVEASAGVTTYWTGGSAPTDGSGATAIDNYAFNIMKTGNATYIVVANQTKGS